MITALPNSIRPLELLQDDHWYGRLSQHWKQQVSAMAGSGQLLPIAENSQIQPGAGVIRDDGMGFVCAFVVTRREADLVVLARHRGIYPFPNPRPVFFRLDISVLGVHPFISESEPGRAVTYLAIPA